MSVSTVAAAVVVFVVLAVLTVAEVVYVARLRRDGREANVVVRNGLIFNPLILIVLLVVLLQPGFRH